MSDHYSPLSYWSPAVYPRTKVRQPYPMAIKTVIVPGSGGGSPPATPTLNPIADNGNGTGAVATIGGSTAGATNFVEVFGVGGNGEGTWSQFSRSGNGTLGLAVADGLYVATAYSSLAGLASPPSEPYQFTVTGGAGQALIRAAVYSYLSTNAGIVGQVGTRVFPVKAPQGVARPYLLYRRVKGGHEHVLSGSAGFALARFELLGVADTYAEADLVAEAVRQAADGAANKTVAGITINLIQLADDEDEEDDFDPPIDGGDDGVYLIRLRYDVQYLESAPTP